MPENISQTVYYEAPRAFSRDELFAQPELFAQRAALFHTPTSAIPEEWIGSGDLDVWLPLTIPTTLEHSEIWGYRSPRLWVDQIQRATGRLRWTPIPNAEIAFHNFDRTRRGGQLVKAVLDALKISTTGRRDGRTIHYFGAIIDDDHKHLAELQVEHHEVGPDERIGCRILVRPHASRRTGA